MKTLTAIAAALILNLGFGAALATAQHEPRQERRHGRASEESRAERIVRQAYLDILGREADPSGLQEYTDAMVNRGWSEADVRRALAASREAREGGAWRRNATGDRAAGMVRRAYVDVLGREPDPTGMREYTMRVMRDGWTEADIRRALRASDEYRRRN